MRKIDIHVHTVAVRSINRYGTNSTYCTPEEIIEKYDATGVEKGVILPEINPECSMNCAQSMEDVIDIVDRYPDRFTWFMNIDPRSMTNDATADFTYFMRYYMERGAKGVGEICANLPFDDPRVENLFHHCERNGLPLTFHISPEQNRYYGLIDDLGLPRLENALRKFPGLTFLGHSQPFWAEISATVTNENRNTYPSGKVIPGRLVTLMRQYPNLCGDLSAGSAFNALSRDPEFGYAFLEEFQDKLYFGTDYCAPENIMPLSGWLDEAVATGKITQSAYAKISRTNAEKLLGL